MPEITAMHKESLSGMDLSTTDEKGALVFYSALFKWEDEPQPHGKYGPGTFSKNIQRGS
jgi:predicted enzyme related to lactoylglutathione lyase